MPSSRIIVQPATLYAGGFMKIGYVRVSDPGQNTIRQDVLMESLGVEKIYVDRASGKDTSRPQLQSMLEYVREGDTVLVESYSRLARSTRDLLDIVEKLNSKGVQFASKKENIDTSTPQGRLMLTVFAGLYQFERECSRERQAEGIREAKKRGVYKGRARIKVDHDKFLKVYTEWKSGNMTANAAQKQLGLTARTFYRRVAEHEGRTKN